MHLLRILLMLQALLLLLQLSLPLLNLVAQLFHLRIVSKIFILLLLLEHLLLKLLLLKEAHHCQLLLLLALINQQILAVELLSRCWAAARVIISNSCWQALALGERIIEVELSASLIAQGGQAEVLAILLHLTLCLLLVDLHQLQVLLHLHGVLVNCSIRSLFFSLSPELLSHLRIQNLLVHANGSTLRVKNPGAALLLNLSATVDFSEQHLLLTQPGLWCSVQHVGVKALQILAQAMRLHVVDESSSMHPQLHNWMCGCLPVIRPERVCRRCRFCHGTQAGIAREWR
mmetsp:Transcript_33411/g.76324  ORF Transcript_33411/g.76324 Transcript_33411/m.76324 type:complete len:288 (-) Transcript_33411:39-902(-)